MDGLPLLWTACTDDVLGDREYGGGYAVPLPLRRDKNQRESITRGERITAGKLGQGRPIKTKIESSNNQGTHRRMVFCRAPDGASGQMGRVVRTIRLKDLFFPGKNFV